MFSQKTASCNRKISIIIIICARKICQMLITEAVIGRAKAVFKCSAP